MTELYIDGTAVVLPQEFSVQVKRENPFFTKNGEYTYDITLQLSNATNAALYKHLNRLNSVSEVETKRRAVLIADNRVYCNGTGIVTGWTDDTVTIQIASGNSELNYVIGADLQISFLDGMPETEELTNDTALQHINSTYPDVEYCLPMLYDRDNNIILNPWYIKGYRVEEEIANELTPGNLNSTFDSDLSRFYAQPYLCAYLKHLFDALGYVLEYNFMDETVYRKLFICHASQTRKWCEMLPGWSVKDFLEQIELLFNATVVVDNRKRTARLLCRSTFYTATQTAHVKQVEDVYEAEMADEEDDPETVQMQLSDVRYVLTDNAYWRGRCLPESVKKGAKKRTIPDTFLPDDDVLYRMEEWFADTDHQRTDTIYTDKQTGRKAIYNTDIMNEFGTGDAKTHWQFVDEFAGIEREEPEQEVELEIIPAEIGQVNKNLIYQDWVTPTMLNFTVPMPVVEDTVSEEETDDEEAGTPVSDLIENSTLDTEDEDDDGSSSGKSSIRLAFYAGCTLDLDVELYQNTLFPLVYTDEYLYVMKSNTYIRPDDLRASMRLELFEKNLWSNTLLMDQRKEVKVNSHDPNLYDTRMVFEIHNRRYLCREIEYTLDAHGRKGAWLGTFYPASISDTEADARWILSDGKWRDGGVWLDNGRWLDE